MRSLLFIIGVIFIFMNCSQNKVPISELGMAIQDIYGKHIVPQKGADGVTYKYMLRYDGNVWDFINDAVSLKEKFNFILDDTTTDIQINIPDKGTSPYLRNIYKWRSPIADIKIEAIRSIDEFSENEMIIVIKDKNPYK